MNKFHQTDSASTELGMVSNYKSLPLPDKLEFIHAFTITGQVAVRKRTTRIVALTPGSGIYHPDFTFNGIDDFNITDVKLISKIDLNKKHSLKKLDLVITSKYNLLYSDGTNVLTQPDEAVFDLTINNVYYPESRTKCFTSRPKEQSTFISRGTEPAIEVEAIGSSFGEVLCRCTGALIVDIGAFFIIRFGRESQLCIPSYKKIVPGDTMIRFKREGGIE